MFAQMVPSTFALPPTNFIPNVCLAAHFEMQHVMFDRHLFPQEFEFSLFGGVNDLVFSYHLSFLEYMAFVATGPLHGEGKVRKCGQELFAQRIPFVMGTDIMSGHAHLEDGLIKIAIVLLKVSWLAK